MFSVLLPVYFRDSPDDLAACLDSLEAQIRPASEVLIVKDGPLGHALEGVIQSYSARLPISTLELPHNKGLGVALQAGVNKCRFDIIARMDADDICVQDRFKWQVGFLEEHPEIDVLSGTIREFDSDPALWFSERRLPVEHAAIEAFGKLDFTTWTPYARLQGAETECTGGEEGGVTSYLRRLYSGISVR